MSIFDINSCYTCLSLFACQADDEVIKNKTLTEKYICISISIIISAKGIANKQYGLLVSYEVSGRWSNNIDSKHH